VLNANSNANKLNNNKNKSLISSDARAAESYNFSHIITARNAKWVCIDFVLFPPKVYVLYILYCYWFILFANYKGF